MELMQADVLLKIVRMMLANILKLAEQMRINIYFSRFKSDFDSNFASKTTTNLTEGTNLYFTDARARSAISASVPINYNSGTGAIGITYDGNFALNASN